ncbi:MAG: hypothetical protein QY312_02895 [Candidatus Dojkabacteria bacterium]|nr:MAG: hypothetical protein QY312_02895 [Candidatus Dojkabacteria bacterium]
MKNISKLNIYKIATLAYIRLTQLSLALWTFGSFSMYFPSAHESGLLMQVLTGISVLAYIVSPLQQFFTYATPSIMSSGESEVLPVNVYILIFSLISLIFILILEVMARIIRILFDQKKNMLQELLVPTKHIGYLFIASSVVYFLTMFVQSGITLSLYHQWYDAPINFQTVAAIFSDSLPGFHIILSIMSFGAYRLIKHQIRLQEEVDLTI